MKNIEENYPLNYYNYILKHSGLEFECAYDYISKDNLPSIKASEAVGFKYMSDAIITKFTRNIKLCENKGQYEILMYQDQISNRIFLVVGYYLFILR